MLFPKKEGAREIQEVFLPGRYRILSELGRGSGSVVYLAMHQKLSEHRALKRIQKDSDAAFRIREAEILNCLKHPQIPTIYDVEEDEDAYYIIEEYMEGESLEAVLLQSSFITLDFIRHVIIQVADILAYMHQLKPHPIVYQDLKPDHVIVGKDSVKLIDFGIASFLEGPGNKFQNYGTPEYCAPEKAKEAKVSVQTDIYAIGKLLETLILAEGTKQSQTLMHIVKKATHIQLKERYPSIDAFLADFTSCMQSNNHSNSGRHLLQKIVVAGSQPRIGTTHLSLSFAQYLNQQNKKTVYQEKNNSDSMRKLARQGNVIKEGGLYRGKDFLGMPNYGGGVEVTAPERAIEILDYGTDLVGASSEKADLFLLLMGSREWELEYADRAYERLKEERCLKVIANYGSDAQAKQYAKRYRRTIYSFPLDRNPFLMTKEKERLFNGLLEKEKKGDQRHWNCRKRAREWSNALIRGIGKLCGKRP